MDVRAQWMRGGTSKCWLFERAELTRAGVPADTLLPRLFGSPDSRQLDGVGGGTSTTSKAMIVERSERDGVDVDFTFAQVGITEPVVDWGSNCGNCSSAVGLFAVEQGWVPVRDGETRVTTYNTNTGQIIVQRVATPGGALEEHPTATMPGSVHPGVEVGLGFLAPAGLTTGRLLPTGSVRDEVEMDGETYEVSMVDAGAPVVLLAADRLGLDAARYLQWTAEVTPWLPLLDRIRRWGAVQSGLARTPEEAERAIPKVGLVGPSLDSDADLQVLMLSMGAPHPAMPITGSVAVTLAASTPGTVVADARPAVAVAHGPEHLRLRTPAGVLTTFTESGEQGPLVGVTRTARTLATTTLHVPLSPRTTDTDTDTVSTPEPMEVPS